MENIIKENPKAFVTAFVALLLIMVRNFVPIAIIPESAYPYLDTVLGALFIFLLGRFTRITKTEAEYLDR
jgi:hypothetical protein